MDRKELDRLKSAYRRYGFNLEREYPQDAVLVFRLKSGYFDNADVISISDASNPSQAFEDFSKLGYACTKRRHSSAEEAEKELFEGFFAVEATQDRLRSEYNKFQKSIVSRYNAYAQYEYINAPYTINGEDGTLAPWKEVLDRLDAGRPTLFLIEAAAGFGKTCTAWEIVSKLISSSTYIPLFSELARYRQARIFRHILLEEIDHTFPTLNSRLVESEIVSGRVITVLDGFDELLREGEDSGETANYEPMLETIGEYLTGRAKIVLTTRRTVLFQGDEFHQWVAENQDKFELVRIRISEPEVSHWISENRLETLRTIGINPENIANPVMLALLRYASEAQFFELISRPDLIVDKYFENMYVREQSRQDLRMEPSEQSAILQSLAKDMVSLKYTAEERDYIVELILSHHLPMIDATTRRYSANERPTRDEISNKLASHALLDRTTGAKEQVGFINEFVLGHFVAEQIMSADEWLDDDMRFLEPAVLSYQPRPLEKKRSLWSKVKASAEFLDYSDRISLLARLIGSVDFPLSEGEASDLHLDRVSFAQTEISAFQFNNCFFHRCEFNSSTLNDVTFLHCRFFDCTWIGASSGVVHSLGCEGDSLPQEVKRGDAPGGGGDERQMISEAKKHVLEKFWPLGKEQVAFKTRPTKVLYGKVSNFQLEDLYNAVENLKTEGILRTPRTQDFVDLNFDRLADVRRILGRS